MRLVSVFILEMHNPDEQNVCPSSSRRIMRPKYKNGQYVKVITANSDCFQVPERQSKA